MVVPSGSSMLLLRGLASGSRIAFSWAAENVGEPALEMPHAVAALLQLHIAAVLLGLVVNRFGPVGIGSVDHGVGEAAQICRVQDGCMVGEQLFGLLYFCRV